MSAASQARAITPSDSDTGPAIRAYLASVRPLRGLADVTNDQVYQRGRSLIERLALSAQGDDPPALALSPGQCADVLSFIRFSEPVVPSEWWKTPRRGPSHHFGLFMVQPLSRNACAKGRSGHERHRYSLGKIHLQA